MMKLKAFIGDCWLFISGFGLTLIGDIVFFTYAGLMVYAGKGIEPFTFGSVEIPKLQGAGATFMDVFILNAAIVIAVVIAFIVRYKYYEPERAIIKKHMLKDKAGFWDNLADDD